VVALLIVKDPDVAVGNKLAGCIGEVECMGDVVPVEGGVDVGELPLVFDVVKSSSSTS